MHSEREDERSLEAPGNERFMDFNSKRQTMSGKETKQRVFSARRHVFLYKKIPRCETKGLLNKLRMKVKEGAEQKTLKNKRIPGDFSLSNKPGP